MKLALEFLRRPLPRARDCGARRSHREEHRRRVPVETTSGADIPFCAKRPAGPCQLARYRAALDAKGAIEKIDDVSLV